MGQLPAGAREDARSFVAEVEQLIDARPADATH
jgi:hypothetical protein